MNKSQLILLSILGLSFATLFYSCEKPSPEEAITNAILKPKGSIQLTAGTKTYTELFSSVTYSESDTMVSFWAIDIDSEDSFITTFGIVPEVGQTKQVSLYDDNGIIFMISGSFQKGGLYTGESGTIKRVNTDTYEIDVNLSNSENPGSLLNMSGTITVGEYQ